MRLARDGLGGGATAMRCQAVPEQDDLAPDMAAQGEDEPLYLVAVYTAGRKGEEQANLLAGMVGSQGSDGGEVLPGEAVGDDGGLPFRRSSAVYAVRGGKSALI